MIFHLHKETASIKDDKDIFQIGDFFVWFKGYFFVNGQFYEDKEAGNYLLSLLKSNLLTDEIGNCNGIFSCVIHDIQQKQLTVCNDRFGFGKLFYVESDNSLMVGNDYWGLVEDLDKAEINQEAYSELLLMRYVFSGHTMVKGIDEILPASIYTFSFDDKSLNKKREEYWSFKYAPQPISEEEAAKKTHDVLNKIVKKYTRGVLKDSNVGINLTGGIDSRYLLSLMQHNGVDACNIQSYTYGDKDCEDIDIARKVAAVGGTEHREYLFEYPFFDFFKPETIHTLTKEIGFTTTYYQGYGAGRLQPLFSESDYLVTGTDGFAIGLMANEELFAIKTKEELAAYIYRTIAPYISEKHSARLFGKDVGSIEDAIKNRILEAVKSNPNNCVSSYYEWIFRNKIRKNILSIYEILNTGTKALFPYYDYGFYDLMLSLPFEALHNQEAYVNAMYSYSFKDKFEAFKSIPIEKRVVNKTTNGYSMSTKKASLLKRGLKKVFALPGRQLTFSSYKTYRNYKKTVLELIEKSAGYNSDVINTNYINQLLKEYRRSEPFFYFALAPVLTAVSFEQHFKELKS